MERWMGGWKDGWVPGWPYSPYAAVMVRRMGELVTGGVNG